MAQHLPANRPSKKQIYSSCILNISADLNLFSLFNRLVILGFSLELLCNLCSELSTNFINIINNPFVQVKLLGKSNE
ncbi:hypothetical protein GJV52_01940 [Neisseria brasiliensis]|nr:hypothetical protein GJV52_01940 [Neisseria brasiliensis]